MDFAGNKSKTRVDVRMVYSGTTSHMTAKSNKVIHQKACSMSIDLADDSIVSEK